MTIFPSFIQMTLDLSGQAVAQELPYADAAGGGFEALVSSLLTALMAVAALTVFIFLIWGAFDYINSSGEKSKIESARNRMTGAITGLMVLAVVLVIFMFIQQILGIQILNFTPASTDRVIPVLNVPERSPGARL